MKQKDEEIARKNAVIRHTKSSLKMYDTALGITEDDDNMRMHAVYNRLGGSGPSSNPAVAKLAEASALMKRVLVDLHPDKNVGASAAKLARQAQVTKAINAFRESV